MASIIQISLFSLLIWVSTSQAAIYGADDRKDLFQMPQYMEIGKSVAIAVPLNTILNSGATVSVQNAQSLEKSGSSYVCRDERFSQQPTIGNCTAFLVGDRYIATAGHCVLPNGIVNDDAKNPLCEKFGWIFGFTANGAGKAQTQEIPRDRVYGCVRILRAETLEFPAELTSSDPGNDFAIIELDRPVVGITPLALAAVAPKIGETVFTIGHPMGMPAKFSGFGKVLDLGARSHLFNVNLDTLVGNSGGPVFNLKKEVVGILVAGHNADTYIAPSGCVRANLCDSTGNRCKEEPTYKYLPRSNVVQKTETWRHFIPKNVSSSAR